jgi:hypothetical protein
MFADSEERVGSPRGSCGRSRSGAPVRLSGLVTAVAAGLLAAAAPASASTMFVHSARSGELSGGRLTLRGVSPRLTYATDAGHSGTTPVRWMQRRFFPPGAPATATLHLAGYRGGEEPTYRLSRPRYNAARHTVSYRAEPLDKKKLPGGAARSAALQPSRFGAASLSIVPHPRVAGGDGGGNDCEVYVISGSQGPGPPPYGPGLTPQSISNWDTDNWDTYPEQILPGKAQLLLDRGGIGRGCHFDIVYAAGPYVTVTIDETWEWGKLPVTTCTTSDPSVWCARADQDGLIRWVIWTN